MKKIIILFCIVLSTHILIAQENNKYVYCELASYIKGMSGKQLIMIDFGQKSELQNDKIYQDEAGQPLKFESMVDAMNFMAKNGWEFVQAYVPVVPVSHYVLKKKINEGQNKIVP